MHISSDPSEDADSAYKAGIRFLQQVGEVMCRGEYPRVEDGGVVVLEQAAIRVPTPSKEIADAERQAFFPRSESWPWEWSSGKPWSPGSPRTSGPPQSSGASSPPEPPGAVAPLLGTDRLTWLAHEFPLAEEAYPGLRSWKVDNGTWLCVGSRLIAELPYAAMFLIYIPDKNCDRVRAWAYWDSPMVAGWIGPRHTNFNDGSICAFHPADRTWSSGQSLVTLLDIYTVWAVRHLHLRLLGFWPGMQVAHHPYERLLEQATNELCGCGSDRKIYGECCRPTDLAQDRGELLIDYVQRFGGGRRCPPFSVASFALTLKDPPNFSPETFVNLNARLKQSASRVVCAAR